MTVLHIKDMEHVKEIVTCIMQADDRVLLIIDGDIKSIVGHTVPIFYDRVPEPLQTVHLEDVRGQSRNSR